MQITVGINLELQQNLFEHKFRMWEAYVVCMLTIRIFVRS